MKKVSYTAEFKAEVVKQVIERGHGVVEVSSRLGVSDKSPFLWVRQAKELQGIGGGEAALLKSEIARPKAELKRTSEERNILKKATAYFARVWTCPVSTDSLSFFIEALELSGFQF